MYSHPFVTRLRVATALLLACAALSACAETDPEPAESPPPGNAVGALHQRYLASAGARPFDQLSDLLENTLYRMGEAPARPLTKAVVVGRVTDVEPGRGFRIEGDDAAEGIETDFDDPRALWRTVHMTVAVDSVVSGEIDRDPVTVGLAFDAASPSLDQITRDLESLGTVLLFLNHSPVFDYDPGVYGTVLDGALLATVDDQGNIRLPVLDGDEQEQLLTGSATVAALQEAADGEQRVIQLDDTGAVAAG